MDAMSTVNEKTRLLVIRGRRDTQGGSPAATISVHDSGVGLRDVDLARLFDAFYTTKPHGMGMGLAISRSIVDAHGGRLWADTDHPGPGAMFSFTLPAATQGTGGGRTRTPSFTSATPTRRGRGPPRPPPPPPAAPV